MPINEFPNEVLESCTLILTMNVHTSETITSSVYNQTTMITDTITSEHITQNWDKFETETQSTDTVLGKGGMGIVKLAKQFFPNRSVALKASNHPRSNHMLLQEANILGSLEHPNIVPIHQIISKKGQPEVVMKYVQGKTLSELVKHRPKEGKDLQNYLEETSRILLLICHALEYAHSKKIVHRDIKCDNIMVGEYNEVFLMDWGLAFNYQTGEGSQTGVVGTPCYIAPEMLSGKPGDIDERTDVYLLGATLHHVLTGVWRHNSNTVAEALQMSVKSAPYDYDGEIPKVLGNIANKACARKKEERYQHIKEFRESLERALKHWQAIQICVKAGAQQKLLLEKVNNTTINSDEEQSIYRLFSRIHSAYDSALELWDNCEEAILGLDSLLLVMIEHYLHTNDPKRANALYSDLSQSNLALEKRIQDALDYQLEFDKAHKIAEQYDPSRSKHGRKTLILSLAISALLLLAFAIAYSMFVDTEVTTMRLLFTISVVMVSAMGGAWVGRKTLFSNQLGQQMAKAMILGAVLAFFNTLVGHLHHADSNAVMTLDVYILGMVFSNLNGAIRSAHKIAVFCGFLATCALFFPVVAHIGLLMAIVVSTLWALADWYEE